MGVAAAAATVLVAVGVTLDRVRGKSSSDGPSRAKANH
jgi:hypothetical protein